MSITPKPRPRASIPAAAAWPSAPAQVAGSGGASAAQQLDRQSRCGATPAHQPARPRDRGHHLGRGVQSADGAAREPGRVLPQLAAARGHGRTRDRPGAGSRCCRWCAFMSWLLDTQRHLGIGQAQAECAAHRVRHRDHPAGPRSAATNDAIAQPGRVLARLTGCIGRVDYEPDESPFAD